MPELDPLALTQALIRCPSVTPTDAGALDVLARALAGLGFDTHAQRYSQDGTADVDNLYARLGAQGPNFCFAGHTDVVPPGDPGAWRVDPFAAEIVEGRLIGRGAVDMKGAIGSFTAAVARFIEQRGADFGGSICFLITGDEEGPAVNGTVKVLDWMKAKGETIDACLVGEPSNPQTLGQMIKIGRRGSLNGDVRLYGVQGHVAYPRQADNPVHRIMRMMDAVVSTPMDHGTDHFPPSNMEVTSIDVGNPSTNVIPGDATARFNIRFNDAHSGAGVIDWLRYNFDAYGARYDLDVSISGESFLTAPGPLTAAMVAAVRDVTGRDPELSTSGGTSDARFIKDFCPVAEFGLMSDLAHKVDESVAVEDLETLSAVYVGILDRFFGFT